MDPAGIDVQLGGHPRPHQPGAYSMSSSTKRSSSAVATRPAAGPRGPPPGPAPRSGTRGRPSRTATQVGSPGRGCFAVPEPRVGHGGLERSIAVVEHRVDQQLAAMATPPRSRAEHEPGRQAAAGARAADHERAGAVRSGTAQPAQRRVAVVATRPGTGARAPAASRPTRRHAEVGTSRSINGSSWQPRR